MIRLWCFYILHTSPLVILLSFTSGDHLLHDSPLAFLLHASHLVILLSFTSDDRTLFLSLAILPPRKYLTSGDFDTIIPHSFLFVPRTTYTRSLNISSSSLFRRLRTLLLGLRHVPLTFESPTVPVQF
jgi:hypothetical protein